MSAHKKRARKRIRQKERENKPSPSPEVSADSSELRQTLEGIFRELMHVEDVLITCREAMDSPLGQNAEIAKVLGRGGIDPLFTQLQRLSKVIEGVGGEIMLTGDIGEDE